MGRYPKQIEHLVEEAETDALAAAAILVDLRPLVHSAASRSDVYALERLQRIFQAAEQLRQRAIARRPRPMAR
jgi:hypothetical protein